MGGLLHLVQRGHWVGPQPAQAPPCCTKCNNPPINGQYTKFVLLLFDVATCGDLVVPVHVTDFGERAFAVAAPKEWNKLPTVTIQLRRCK